VDNLTLDRQTQTDTAHSMWRIANMSSARPGNCRSWRKQEAQLLLGWPTVLLQSYKYNHTLRIWEVDVVGRQKIVIPSGIGLAAVLAVRQLSWSVKLCLSLYL